MTTCKQLLIAALGVLVSMPFLVPLQAPGMAYAMVGGATAWAATWLYARWKFGKSISVRPSLRVDE